MIYTIQFGLIGHIWFHRNGSIGPKKKNVSFSLNTIFGDQEFKIPISLEQPTIQRQLTRIIKIEQNATRSSSATPIEFNFKIFTTKLGLKENLFGFSLNLDGLVQPIANKTRPGHSGRVNFKGLGFHITVHRYECHPFIGNSTKLFYICPSTESVVIDPYLQSSHLIGEVGPTN